MKTLTKLFLAVVALFAYSCVTDTTEDLGVKLGGQTTEITLSLEESRTQLGEKVDGLYPLFWSEGDKISVNGIASAELSAQQAGSSKATFSVDGTLSSPYCIAYPAAPAGQVVFAENQTHVSNTTFGSGVSTMYAYGDTSGIQLNHLTGVLKIGITGEATISLVQISTVDRKPIAGTFDFDFEKGEAKATDASKYVINYNCPITADDPDGFALSSTPQYIHVAVPAGVYDELYVTLYDTEGGVMYATVGANENKPLAVGKVREFKYPIGYAPNSEVFVIKDKESLKAFAAEATSLTKDVLFVADVDMTGEEWTPVDWNLASETSDGGVQIPTLNGNGYAIKGLTAPLFGTVSANIKGLHLVDVNINESVNPNVGALARSVVALQNLSPVVSHCSVSGKVTSNCDFTPGEDATPANTGIGGLVGSIVGASVTNCSSSATVEMGKVLSSAVVDRIVCPCGGVVGAAMPLETMVSSVTDCENSGAVSFVGGTAENPLNATHTMVGGVLGYSPIENAGGEIANLTNRGAITANGYLASSCRELNMGGVIGYANAIVTVKNCYNYGTVSMPAGSYQMSNCMYIGGVAGALPTCDIDNIHNYGEVLIAKEVKAIGIIVAGVVGKRTSTTYTNTFANSSNNAPVSCAAEQYEYPDGEGSYVYYRVAGVLGWNEGALENLVNNEKGVITVNGSMYHAVSTAYCCSVAGGVAVSGATSTGDAGIVNLAAVNVNASLKTSTTFGTSKARMTIGGAMGHVIPDADEVMIKRVHNGGNVTVNGTYNSTLNLGGTVGMLGYKANTTIMTGITNSGTVTVSKDIVVDDVFYCGGLSARVAVGNNLEPNIVNSGAVVVEGGEFKGTAYIGGAYGWTDKAVKDIHNNGTVTINGGTFSGAQLNIAGAIGYVDKGVTKIYNTGNVTLNNCTIAGNPAIAGGIGIVAKKATISYVENSGAVTLNGIKATNSTSTSSSVGGCVALFTNDYGGAATYYTNTGAITLDKDCSINTQLMVAGCVAKHNKNDGGSFTDLTNNAPIKMYARTNSNIYLGGVAGYVYPSATSRRLLNDVNGDITLDVTKTSNYTDAVKIMVAGVAGQLRCHSVPLENRGDIYIGGNIQTTIGVSGVITQPNNMDRSDLTNSGNITIDAVIDGGCRVGGIEMGGDNSGTKKHWVNSGNITFTKDSWVKGFVYAGGLLGKANSASIRVIEGSAPSANSGTITFSGKCGDGGAEDNLYIGGLTARIEAFKQLTGGFTNSGSVIFDGVMDGGTAYVGGLVGSCSDNPLEEGLEWSGDLVFTGEKLQATSGYVGGIFGTSVSAIPNAIVYSNVEGIGCTGAGMITGSARTDTVVAKNAKIGGSIALTLDTEEKADGTISNAPIVVGLTADNIHEYIYGGETVWPAGSDYDGCSFLSVKPEN